VYSLDINKMKVLNLKEMERIEGGRDKWCVSSGVAVGMGAALLIGGIATGGVALLVAGGLSSYFGAASGLVCAMRN
jgi:hypothetical protein